MLRGKRKKDKERRFQWRPQSNRELFQFPFVRMAIQESKPRSKLIRIMPEYLPKHIRSTSVPGDNKFTVNQMPNGQYFHYWLQRWTTSWHRGNICPLVCQLIIIIIVFSESIRSADGKTGERALFEEKLTRQTQSKLEPLREHVLRFGYSCNDVVTCAKSDGKFFLFNFTRTAMPLDQKQVSFQLISF